MPDIVSYYEDIHFTESKEPQIVEVSIERKTFFITGFKFVMFFDFKGKCRLAG